MSQRFNVREVISLLRESGIISKVEIKTFDEIKGRGVYKIRCNLIPSKYKLEIKLVNMKNQILYSYQLFCETPIIRWDNSPHYPDIKSYPHHFHTKDSSVIDSELTGNVLKDLKIILSLIKRAIIDYED